ncbi:Gfo/Idh/MocA family protein [Caldifermentibacillus hisashii]|uniref:Gfo/Idh/MocA family protein n=1 Tax=Caldifermentibacillus hisashii TaxID=996558 RepID=UPI001C1034A5|nr:Gfo/Idh/MocA family oxidoreductase [Caldifermentibacillus hisashii]MBU5342132.1 Gfo/Idh/MocA family oxidoreductase [Caldifermentibacillus hisashii]
MSIRFGIIGFGFMGHVHEEMITTQVEGAEVTAICDIIEERMNDAITENVKKFTNADELLAQDDVDVVLIVVPNHLHKKMVIKAAQAGKNIICEKPVAMSVKELDEMIAETDRYGVKFTVHQQRRFDQDFRMAKAIYDNKAVGDVYTIKSSLYGFNGNMHDWHVYKKYGGGMLYDWGVHLIDQILFMIDSKLVSLYADVRNVINDEVDDYFKVIMKFENGITSEIELGTYYLADKQKWFERHWFIGGNTGSAYLDGFEPDGKIVRTTRLLKSVPGKIAMTKSGPTRSFGPPPADVLYTEELPKVNTKHIDFFTNYVNAYHGNGEFLVKISEVKKVLSLMEAIWTSAETGNLIRFE